MKAKFRSTTNIKLTYQVIKPEDIFALSKKDEGVHGLGIKHVH